MVSLYRDWFLDESISLFCMVCQSASDCKPQGMMIKFLKGINPRPLPLHRVRQ